MPRRNSSRRVVKAGDKYVQKKSTGRFDPSTFAPTKKGAARKGKK